MGKVVLCSFANQQYRKALQRLVYEAHQSGLFDKVLSYTDEDLSGEYWERYGRFITNNPRGYGYWIWKSHLVNKAFCQLDEGDVLVYLDAGCGVNRYGVDKFKDYLVRLKQSSAGILCFSNGYIEGHWDKGDVLDFLDVRGRDDILSSEQIMGGIWMMRKNSVSVALCQRWEEIVHKHLHLVDDSPSVSPNPKGFCENRHDQTIFSLLVKTTGGAVVLSSTEVEVDGPYRDKGYRTYRRFKHNVFLALREKEGLVYDCPNAYLRRLHELLWDMTNWFEDHRQPKKILHFILFRKINKVIERWEQNVFRAYHHPVKESCL